MPTLAFRDLAVDADELWGDRAHALQELVGSASSDRQAASHLERALAERLAGAPAPDPVVAQAVLPLMSGRRAEVAALASSLCISERPAPTSLRERQRADADDAAPHPSLPALSRPCLDPRSAQHAGRPARR
jgi:hypothetical protein